MPKHLLVLNSGVRLPGPPLITDGGEWRVHFREIWRSDDVYKVQGHTFDEILWVRRLPWAHRDREYIEMMVKARMVNRDGS